MVALIMEQAMLLVAFFFFFLQVLVFRAVLGSSEKQSRRGRGFPYALSSPTHMASHIVNSSHQSSTFATTVEPTLTCHCHPKSVVYMRIHCWCCAVYGFGQMHHDMHLQFPCHTECFHCPKNPPSSEDSFFPFP